MIARIREIHEQHGCKIYHDPDEYGINQHLPSQNGEIIPLGSRVMGAVSLIFELLKDEFGLKHIKTI